MNNEFDDDEQEMILVEVAYATPEKQLIVSLTVAVGTSAYEAAVRSNIIEEFKGIDLESDSMGIFSVVLDGKTLPTPKQYQLRAKDRVEIYRPLTIDPKQARSNRAKVKKDAEKKLKAAALEKKQKKEKENKSS